MRKPIILLCAALALPASADINFTAFDLSSSNKLLFGADARSPDYGEYSTLFLGDVKDRSLQQLTFFPEEILLLQQKDVIQIQNRFGVFRSGPGFQKIAPIPLFPSFVAGSEIQNGKIAPMQTSPDGRYLLYLRPRSAAYGDLTLLDIAKSEEVVISDRIELSLKELPAIWSADSSFVVFAKSLNLYYFSLSQLQQGRILTESLRLIGTGGISNVRWASNGTLYYLSGSIVFAIDPSELFTRALYAGFLEIGRIEGRIPFDFDANFDRFWIAPDGARLLLDKGGRNIFLYTLRSGDFHDLEDPTSLPYLYLPRDTLVRKVLWSSNNTVTILCETWKGGKGGTTVFRLIPELGGRLVKFQQTADTGVRDIAISPDEDLVALTRNSDVVWKDYSTWKDVGSLAHPSPLHVDWLDDDEILIAGSYFTERYSLITKKETLVALSQAEKTGFAKDGVGIQSKTSGLAFKYDGATGSWTGITALSLKDPSLVSSSYRIYLETSTRGSYENLIMVRDAVGFGTVSLIPPETIAYENFPTADQDVDFSNFTHGSRIRRREACLVFNGVDSVEGLTETLQTLASYGVHCTFFLNGEFIRRYPDAVNEIAQSGHEVGSLFSTYFNMTDARFKVDAAFIKNGLARTEDDYFDAAGKELFLLWHAPYYIVESEIIKAAQSMNYTYIGRDLDTYDWVTKNVSNQNMGIYLPSASLVERIVAEKKPGSIIPILLGPPEGGERGDYLFQKLDLIVNELVKLGYDIVPVSTLMEHAR